MSLIKPSTHLIPILSTVAPSCKQLGGTLGTQNTRGGCLVVDDERRPRCRIIAEVFGRNRRSGIRRRTRKWSRMASIPISCMWSAVKTSKVSSLFIKTIVDQVNPSKPSRNLPSLLQKHRSGDGAQQYLLTYRFPLAKWFPTLNMIGLM